MVVLRIVGPVPTGQSNKTAGETAYSLLTNCTSPNLFGQEEQDVFRNLSCSSCKSCQNCFSNRPVGTGPTYLRIYPTKRTKPRVGSNTDIIVFSRSLDPNYFGEIVEKSIPLLKPGKSRQ